MGKLFWMKKLGNHVDELSPSAQTPLKQNWRAFLQAQPLICDNCGNFTDTPREYCERCGSRYSLRKATKKDFVNYQLKNKNVPHKVEPEITQSYSSSHFKKKMSNKEKNLFLKSKPYLCVKCYNFTDKPEPDGPQKPDKFYYETYCELCGSSDSIRVATKKDIDLYLGREKTNILDHLKEQTIYLRQKEKKSRLEIGEPGQIYPQSVKNEDFLILSSKNRLYKEKSISNGGIQKISEKTISEIIQTETDQSPPIISPEDKVKEAPKISAKSQIEKISSIPEIEESEFSEKTIVEKSQLKAEKIKQTPLISVKKDKKIKEIAQFCSFCGTELGKMVKFCHQCGTIIKYK
ncbi:MAG: hypothetical protein ACFFEY_12790 [Candidatus Thorarchaeota archaeon]